MTASARQARAVRIAMLAGHLACLSAIHTGVSKVAVLVAGLAYLIRAFGVTAGFHRLLAHGSFKAGRATQFALALLGSMATQGASLVGFPPPQSPPLFGRSPGPAFSRPTGLLARPHRLDVGQDQL